MSESLLMLFSMKAIEFHPFYSHWWPRQNFSLQHQYDIKQTSDKNKEKYQFGDYKLIQFQILKTNIARNVWQTVRRIINKILGVRVLRERIERSVMFYLSLIAKNKQKFINSLQTRRLRIPKKKSYKIVRECITSISQDQRCIC